ncbi:MAG: PIN domain-containing protein [Pseudonocardiaceae bacterium]
MARLILDTGVLVDAYRGRLNLAAITSTDNAAVPAVVVAEYLHGVLLTPDPDRAERQRTFLQEMLSRARFSDIPDVDVRLATLGAATTPGRAARGYGGSSG